MQSQQLCRPRSTVFFLLCLAIGAVGRAQGTPIGFEETFALAADRAKALEQLIPGTEDYYFFHCLHRQNTGAFGDVAALLKPWIQRHGRTARVLEIENRQALLTAEANSVAAFTFLQQRLELSFDHQRQVAGAKPDLPSALEASVVAPATLTPRALQRHPGTVDGFKDRALEALASGNLDQDVLMSLMKRLRRPDIANLATLVVRNLAHPQSRGFGSLPIHKALTLEQLEEVARQQASVLNDNDFVDAYLRRLVPDADTSWRHDLTARAAWLDRMLAFVNRLAPAHNSLKAHVLYHRLRLDLQLGAPDKARFMAYLKLPRRGSYVNPEYLRAAGNAVADLNRDYPTELGRISNDDALVRDCLMHFFATEDDFQAYAELVQIDWLRRLFAETRILLGKGDMERMYSLLNDPAYYEALKQRVEITFPPINKVWFGAGEAVAIDAEVKNVPALLVKVFEINAFNYYVETGKEVDASVNLDGLVANQESSQTYNENPLRRVRRHFDLPMLGKPGVYIVELLGNGIASRAVIHKGRLQYTEHPSAAGHRFTVRDEGGKKVADASLWIGGREYKAGTDGTIMVPFSTSPGQQKVILRHGGIATLETFQHQAEQYVLSVEFHVAREALLPGKRAKVVIRPTLLVDDRPASMTLLEEPVLQITSRDTDGVASTLTVRNLELASGPTTVHEFQVPEGVSLLVFAMRGRVKDLAGNPVDLVSQTDAFPLNGIDATPVTSCPLLGKNSDGWFIDVLGKNGEAIADRAVQLVMVHRDYSDPIEVMLKTDAKGRIKLGALPGIESVRASGLPDDVAPWNLREQARTWPESLHGVAGELLRLPWQGAQGAFSLLEVRGGIYVRDASAQATVVDGFLEMRDLQPGDYDLLLEEPARHVAVRVTKGTAAEGWAIGRDRLLQLGNGALLQIRNAALGRDGLKVQLANTSASTRVMVFTTRYLPAFDPFDRLRAPGRPPADVVAIEHADSSYFSGREIGDEYRYILERRFAAKYPGNMLARPGLLLNPWALPGETSTGWGAGKGGGNFGQGRGGRRAGGTRPGEALGAQAQPPGTFANLSFLPAPAPVLANLKPDQDGTVVVPTPDLGAGQMVHVVALDSESTIYTTLIRNEMALQPDERTLTRALDSKRHFAEQRRIDFVDKNGTAVVEDAATSKIEAYDSLASVHRLFTTLSGDAGLQEFAFLLGWPTLSKERKLEEYGKHASHELHFFLFRKDPTFFNEVVKPYLANKAHKKFLDHWLLGDDLTRFLEPWSFERLNVFERILLSQRLPGAVEGIVRHVNELYDLRAVDPEQQGRLFDTVLGLTVLDTEGGLAGQLGDLQDSLRRADKPREVAANAPAPSTAAPGAPAPERARALHAGEEAEKKAEDRAELAASADKAPAKDGKEVRKAEGEANKPGPDLKLVAPDDQSELFKETESRNAARVLYREPEQTRQYAESDWWHRRIEESGPELITANAFWRDYANARGKPFFSTSVAEAHGNLSEMLVALAVLDLPFEAGKHVSSAEGARLTMRPASPLLLVRKELVEAKPAERAAPILVSQNYYRLDARYRHEGNERLDNWVTDEFLTGTAYGCQVVITNPTSSPRKLDLLLQIPKGAIPVNKGFQTRGLSVRLEPYATVQIEYAFYWPEPGTFAHYPVQVARNAELLAHAEPKNLKVVDEPTRVDTTSWDHVSQEGTTAQVLAFLDSANLQRTDLSRIAWRMREKPFFTAVLEKLKQRHAYAHVLWSYAILHRDPLPAREFLRHADGFVAACGRYLQSPLLDIDPVERQSWQMLEYEPLFNPRAHRFGRRREILNQQQAQEYLATMQILCYRPQLDDADWMNVTYCLLLQDRTEEALQGFSKVNPDRLPMRVQYDYMRAYLDFFSPTHALARSIAERHKDHPVPRWRDRFRDVLSQLDEAEGRNVVAGGPGDRTRNQTALAATEPALELAVEGRRIALRHKNLESCEVNYYEMDVEFLFSTHPFVQQGASSFAWIKPNLVESKQLAKEGGELAFELPAQFQNANVLVEVRAAGLIRRQACFANSLALNVVESYGQLQVDQAANGKPLPKVYVKVFARLPGGTVRFHKDGYTDLRGRFDYASVSGEATRGAERFAVLVLSEADGAAIREVAPPLK